MKLSQLLNENKSTDSIELWKILENSFNKKEVVFDHPEDPLYETIGVTVRKTKNIFQLYETIKKIKEFITKFKWYVSRENVIGDTGFLVLHPKYSKGIVNKTPKILYHVTPTKNINRILEKGLIAKSEYVGDYYPNRIYVADNLYAIEEFTKERKRRKMSKEEAEEPYSVLKIKTNGLNIKLYKDLACSWSGCYFIQGIRKIPSENINIMNKQINESIEEYIDEYMEGGCVEFAYALQDTFGNDLQLEAIWGNYDPDDEDAIPELIHLYCISKTKDKNLGCDIKGWRNLNKIKDDFHEYVNIDDSYIDWVDRDQVKKAIKNSGGDLQFTKEGYDKAKKIIKENIESYK